MIHRRLPDGVDDAPSAAPTGARFNTATKVRNVFGRNR